MNKDHEESLGHYLEYFGRRSRSLAYSKPQITEFSTESMTLEYGSPRQSWTYKFTPPMQTGQARVRLEEMHREAKEGLGISDVEIDRLSLSPQAWFSILLCLALNLWLILTPAPSIAHIIRWQSPMFRPIFSLFSIAPTSQNIGNSIKIFWCGLLGVAHFAEIFACLNPLLRRYNVKSPLTRFFYRVFCQIGGFPVWQSLRDEGRKQESKVAKKH
ncbi:DUF2470 domain-containing protein [Sporobolomyces salmoneus]|uniref:DUF2470 domain-containing protein n=1 Tax=Sporobolomyces salmoneus TaxID=183962 RepID=UPI0031808D12